MKVELTLAEATAVYKAVEQCAAQLRLAKDGYAPMRIAALERIEQKIEEAILAE